MHSGLTTADAAARDHPVSLWVPIGLAAAPLVALGLARFAYALLLPAMQADLDWSYIQAGTMNTANAAGYLLGAVLTARLAARFGERLIFTWGIFSTAIALIGCGATTSFAVLLLLRFAAGVFGALAFVVGATLAAEAGAGSARDRQGMMIALYFGGGGLGIALSSIIVPLTLAAGPAGWRWSWVGFGGVSAVAGLLAVSAIRAPKRPDHDASVTSNGALNKASLGAISTAYTLFGAGYIAYMTFIVAFLRSEAVAPATISAFWVVLGLSSAAAGVCWGPVLARLNGGWPMVLVLAINTCGALIPLIMGGAIGVFVSAVLFGGSLMAAPSAATAFVRKARPRREWTASLGRLTVLFGFGQCIGPVVAGWLSDNMAGLWWGLFLSAGILALATVTAALQREPQ